jgi:hypothetical protein
VTEVWGLGVSETNTEVFVGAGLSVTVTVTGGSVSTEAIITIGSMPGMVRVAKGYVSLVG